MDSTDTSDTKPTFPTADSPALVPPGQATLDRVVQGAHDTVDRVAASVAPKVQRVQESVESAQTAVRERGQQAVATGERWTENLRTTVRDNPLTAIAAAVVVGLIVARL